MAMTSTINWQSKTKTLGERIKTLFKGGSFSDVTLNVGGSDCNKSFNVHKTILAASSSVFEQMFYGQLTKSAKEEVTTVEIIDIHPHIFEKLISYMYNDTCNLSDVEDAILLHTAANKYMIDDLEDKCLKYLVETATPDSALSVLEYASFIDNINLKASALGQISATSELVFNSRAFPEVKVSTLKSLLSDCKFSCSEVIVLNTVLNYAVLKVRDDDKEGAAGADGDYGDEADEGLMSLAKEYLIDNDLLKGIEMSALMPQDFANGIKFMSMFSNEERLQMVAYKAKLSLDLPFFLNANHKRGTGLLKSLNRVVDTIRATIATPSLHLASVLLETAALDLTQDFPHGNFECNFLITTTTDAYIKAMEFTNYFRYLVANIVIEEHLEDNTKVVFEGDVISFHAACTQCSIKFRAGTPYVWKTKFVRQALPTGVAEVKCFKLLAKCTHTKAYFGDHYSIGAISVEAYGWFPSNMTVTFCATKLEY